MIFPPPISKHYFEIVALNNIFHIKELYHSDQVETEMTKKKTFPIITVKQILAITQ